MAGHPPRASAVRAAGPRRSPGRKQIHIASDQDALASSAPPETEALPGKAADRYMSVTGKGDSHHERFRTRAGLRQLCRGLRVWDYTYTVLAEPARFSAGDLVPGPLQPAPPAVWKALTPIMPTFIWVGTQGTAAPRGPVTKAAPRPVDGIPQL